MEKSKFLSEEEFNRYLKKLEEEAKEKRSNGADSYEILDWLWREVSIGDTDAFTCPQLSRIRKIVYKSL